VSSASPYDSIAPEDVQRGRLLAAVAYLPGLCLLGLLGAPENAFIGFHARQGLLLFTRRVVPTMLAQGVGRIVSVSSVSAQRGGGMYSKVPYSAAKAANGEVMRLPYLGTQIERVPF